MWVRVVTSRSSAAKCNIVYGTAARDVSMNRGPGNNEEKPLKIDNKLLFFFFLHSAQKQWLLLIFHVLYCTKDKGSIMSDWAYSDSSG